MLLLDSMSGSSPPPHSCLQRCLRKTGNILQQSLLTFCLTFFAHLLTFFLASLLIFFLTILLAYLLTLCLTFFAYLLTFCLTFFPASDILSDGLSSTSSDILSNILSGISSDIVSGVLSGKSSASWLRCGREDCPRMRSDREKRCANGSRKRGGGGGGDGRRGQRGQEGGAEADVKSTNPHLNKASIFSGEMLLLVFRGL